jgi:hypothetical protein
MAAVLKMAAKLISLSFSCNIKLQLIIVFSRNYIFLNITKWRIYSKWWKFWQNFQKAINFFCDL